MPKRRRHKPSRRVRYHVARLHDGLQIRFPVLMRRPYTHLVAFTGSLGTHCVHRYAHSLGEAKALLAGAGLEDPPPETEEFPGMPVLRNILRRNLAESGYIERVYTINAEQAA